MKMKLLKKFQKPIANQKKNKAKTKEKKCEKKLINIKEIRNEFENKKYV